MLNSEQIQALCENVEKPMISPYFNDTNKIIKLSFNGEDAIVPSFGTSEAGYDVRLGGRFKIPQKGKFANGPSHFCYRPANKDYHISVNYEMISREPGQFITIEPGQFMLGVTMEKFCMPSDVMGICTGKSTLARMGLHCLVTPLEAGWEGYLTLELVNHSPNPIDMVVGMGICQINFHKIEPTQRSYAKRQGKYMDQPYEPIIPRI